MTKKSQAITLSICLLLSAAVAVPLDAATADPAEAWYTSNYLLLGIGGDLWWNYDQDTTLRDPFVDLANARYHTDWPITHFYWDSGDPWWVGYLLCDRSNYEYCLGGGSSGHVLRADDGAGPIWSQNGGKKNATGCNVWDVHYNAYGRDGSTNGFHNTYWNYWSPATTHWDYNDGSGCTGNRVFGYSDDAYNTLAQSYPLSGRFQTGPGQNWYNIEPYRVETYNWGSYVESHVWQNGQWVTPVHVDPS